MAIQVDETEYVKRKGPIDLKKVKAYDFCDYEENFWHRVVAKYTEARRAAVRAYRDRHQTSFGQLMLKP